MTWTRDEAEREAYAEVHGGTKLVLGCPGCGNEWVATTGHWDELDEYARYCPDCGEGGEEQ